MDVFYSRAEHKAGKSERYILPLFRIAVIDSTLLMHYNEITYFPLLYLVQVTSLCWPLLIIYSLPVSVTAHFPTQIENELFHCILTISRLLKYYYAFWLIFFN